MLKLSKNGKKKWKDKFLQKTLLYKVRKQVWHLILQKQKFKEMFVVKKSLVKREVKHEHKSDENF